MPAQMEQAVRVGPQANVITVEAEGHRWVSVSSGASELSRESGGAAVASFSVTPGDYLVRTDGALRSVTTGYAERPPILDFGDPSAPTPSALRLSSDAAQRHPVDAVAEIPADGESFVLITVERQGGISEVYLRTTGGTLLDEAGQARVRSVRLRGGTARFRLVSATVPGLVTVSAFGADRASRAELPIEFV